MIGEMEEGMIDKIDGNRKKNRGDDWNRIGREKNRGNEVDWEGK